MMGWETPLLPGAAAWLRERYGEAEGVLVVVPARRAGRRLVELWLGDREAAALPEVLTVGELPERLMVGQRAVADGLTSELAWAQALRDVGAERLRPLLPDPPGEGDVLGWWALGKAMRSVTEQLAAGGRVLADVVEVVPGEERDRYACLAAIEGVYHASLADSGWVDAQRARLAALEEGRLQAPGPIVLVGVSDPPGLVARMLERVQGEVVSLVFGPASEAEGFDALGGLVTEYWAERAVDLEDEMLRVVDKQGDQPAAVVEALAERAAGRSVDEVSVGLGDEAMAGAVVRALDMAGSTGRFAAGTQGARTSLGVLLSAWAAHVADGGLRTLGDMARHPAVAAWLGQGHGPIDRLDAYLTEHLSDRATDWLGDPEAWAPVRAMAEQVASLLPEDWRLLKPLGQWSEAVAGGLSTVFGSREPGQAMAEALTRLGGVLREQAGLGEADWVPEVDFGEALRLTAARFAEQAVPTVDVKPAVEVMGYLELALDDAPVAVLTSLNEGALPGGRVSDAFLPDGLRGQLGLADDRRRLARDAYVLNTLVHSREVLVATAARRGDAGDPLLPSRLVLRCEAGAQRARVERFCDEERAVKPVPSLVRAGGVSRFGIPAPLLPVEPIESLAVTAFGDYLKCPYRFYLKHVLRLRAQDDQARELDPLGFGVLAHAVLEGFGRSELKDSAQADVIAGWLSEALDDQARGRLGDQPGVAVRLQLESLRARLQAFASWQAEQADQGWRIEQVEVPLRGDLTVDGQGFGVRGKIDRVDVHADGRWRVLDYKTGDAGEPPKRAHRVGGKWVSLQLPLYLDLVPQLSEQLGLAGEAAEAGYVVLPKKLDAVKAQMADWSADELAAARSARDAVVRGVRAQVFWPPKLPPVWGDEYSGLCADGVLERGELIERVADGLGGAGE